MHSIGPIGPLLRCSLKRRRGAADSLASFMQLTSRLCPIPRLMEMMTCDRRVHLAAMQWLPTTELRLTRMKPLNFLPMLVPTMMLLLVVQTGALAVVFTLMLPRVC